MSRLPTPLRALLLAAVLSSAAVSSFSIPAILERQSTCAAGQASCPAGTPDNFCCPQGSTCIALAANTTVLCCPNSPGNCHAIVPISCDMTLMNSAINPDSNVKTTALGSKLAACGKEKCCPFGFTCRAGNTDQPQCVMDDDQTVPPPGVARPSTTASPSRSTAPPTSTPASSTATGLIATQAPATGPEQKAPDSEGSGQAFPTTAVIVGTVVGVLGGAALTGALLFFFYRRRRGGSSNNSSHGHGHFPFRGSGHGEGKMHRHNTSTSSFGNIISDPIVHDNSTLRTDFILKTPTSQTGPRSAQSSPTRFAGVGAARTNGPAPPRSQPQQQAGRLSTMFRRGSTSTEGHSPTHGAGGGYPLPTTPERSRTVGGVAGSVAPIRGMRGSPSSGNHAGAAGGYTIGRAPQPVTPRLQREPSSESINVFADPSTVGRGGNGDDGRRLTQATTFTDLMEEADLGNVMRGQGYVPPSAQNTPARR